MVSNLIFSVREASVSFGKKILFDNLDVNIHKGSFIALIGKNGVGKSTLMNIIIEKQDLDSGEIWKQSGLKICYFSQQFNLNENNTVEKELMKILSGEDEHYKIDIFCNNLNLDKKELIHNLSGGQKKKSRVN